jgi:hypothetical protein
MKGKTFPQPNSWNNGKNYLCLEKNKNKQEDDIKFLLEEVTDFETLLLAVTNKRSQEEEMHSGNDAWVRQYPYLCFCLVIMEDKIMTAYSKLFNVED